MGSEKRPKTFDSRSRGQQGWGHCAKFGKPLDKACRVAGSGCFSCFQTGHFGRDCPHGAFICFHCNNASRKKADCPRLIGGVVAEPTLATLQMTNGHQGKVEALVLKNRAFQLTFEEERATPDVVTGMYPYHICYFFHCLCLCVCLFTFRVVFSDGFPALVLFDLSAT